MTIAAPERVETTPLDPPGVYCAGPIDYIEHRSRGDHLVTNWRHRYFAHLPIKVLCPTCLNVWSTSWEDVMGTNSKAMADAQFFVGYFPGDVATFGTPIETDQWARTAMRQKKAPPVLIHPAKPGVFVQGLQEDWGLVVVRTFEEAGQWLRRQLTPP